MKTQREALEQLHQETARYLNERLKAAQGSDEGVPASLIKEIREFLKDNNVTLMATPPSDEHTREILESVPFQPGEPSYQ